MTILGTHLEALVVKWYCKQYNVTLRREQGLFRLKCVAVGCTDPDCLCSQFACTADANGDFKLCTKQFLERCALTMAGMAGRSERTEWGHTEFIDGLDEDAGEVGC